MADSTATGPEYTDISSLPRTALEAQLDCLFVVDLNYLGIREDGLPKRQSGVYPEQAECTLTLVEVKRRECQSPGLRPDPCTLLFRGSHDCPLVNDVHVLSNDSLGRLALFLSPVQVSAAMPADLHPEGRFYEAVIS